nr:MAG TPA: hypothetical protein [Caudoviricetes sp.]
MLRLEEILLVQMQILNLFMQFFLTQQIIQVQI